MGLCGWIADITMPSECHEKPHIIGNEYGEMDFTFRPREVGLHQLSVAYDGSPINGSPFYVYVNEVQAGHATAFGPGLSYGVVYSNCEFTVVTKDARIGGKNITKLL